MVCNWDKRVDCPSSTNLFHLNSEIYNWTPTSTKHAKKTFRVHSKIRLFIYSLHIWCVLASKDCIFEVGRAIQIKLIWCIRNAFTVRIRVRRVIDLNNRSFGIHVKAHVAEKWSDPSIFPLNRAFPQKSSFTCTWFGWHSRTIYKLLTNYQSQCRLE